jgi:polyhydroxybutyrate depolymerase
VSPDLTVRRGFSVLKALALIAALVCLAFLAGACRGGGRGNARAVPSTATSSDSTAAATGAAGCGHAHATGSSVETLTSDGRERSYRLYLPPAYDGRRLLPLVLDFHGFAGIARDQEAYTAFKHKAEAEGFITVTPDGSGEPQRWYLAGTRLPGYTDDVAFVRQLIDSLEASLCVDPARVYATGISNGGGFASLLGCELNDKIAAIAPVAGELFVAPRCLGKTAIPVVAFHGTDDPVVSFTGRGGGQLGVTFGDVRGTMKQWAAFNGCNPAPSSQRIAADVVLESYGGCARGADVHLYVIEGGGHTWPGAIDIPGLGKTTHSISATDLIWRFFAAHPKG